ncbi:MAG: cytochrome c maturation protein CcmE [Anaerolineae bacterium]|nr:cytochrome c maturation protein CcmE [Anaerolineae bacterium]
MAESSTILRGKVESNQANKKIKFIVGGAVVLGLIVYLIASAISSSGAYYREVAEVVNEKAALTGKSLRVSGNIVTESIKYDPTTLNLSFAISDPKDSGKQLAIHFHGVKPDQMDREGSSAIVEGSLGPNGIVEANNLLLKCPSRYDEYEEIKVEAVK